MAMSAEALDIILRLQGVPTYTAGMSAASDANDEFAASSKRAGAASTEAAAASERQKGAAAVVGKAAKAGGLLLAAAAVEGIKMSINFGKQMEMIHTQAGATQGEVERMKTAIVGMKGVKQSPIELAEGLYHLESIGLRGRKALEGLRTAAQGAAVGNAKLEDTATALGAAWIVGAKGAGNLHNVMGILNATVGAGNLRMEELVQSLGSGIIPVSKVAHISIQDIGAALATLSDSGYNASSGMAQLGTSLHFLYDPTTKAKKALESIGLTSQQLFTEMAGKNGLHGALALLKTHLEGVGGSAEQAEKIGEILPGGRGKVLLTLIEELERFENKKKAIIANSGAFSSDVKATMETPAYKIAEAWSQFQKMLIRVGEAMEGPASSAMIGLMGIMQGVLGVILLMTDHGKLLVPIILALAGGFAIYKTAVMAAAIAQAAYSAVDAIFLVENVTMLAGLTSLTGAWILLSAAMDANPVGVIALGIAALAAGVVLLILHFKEVVSFLQGPWGTVLLLLAGPFIGFPILVAVHFKAIMGAMSSVINWIKSHWPLILAILIAPWLVFGAFILEHKKQIINDIKSIPDWIGKNWLKIGAVLASPFVFFWNKVSEVFNWVKKEAKALFNYLSHLNPGKIFTDVLGFGLGVGSKVLGAALHPHFAEGGVMPYSGFAMINERGPGERVFLPGGSTVEPSSANSLLQVRAHTPTPTGMGSPSTLVIEAYLELPKGAGRSLFKLITRESAVKGART